MKSGFRLGLRGAGVLNAAICSTAHRERDGSAGKTPGR
jgi:hypothetical protein